MNYHTELKKFRDERGLTKMPRDLVGMTFKELIEAREAYFNDDIDNLVEELTDIKVFVENGISQLGHDVEEEVCFAMHGLTIRKAFIEIAEALSTYDLYENTYTLLEISRIVKLTVEHLGYDFDACMLETAKKINSRKGAMNDANGKWEKLKGNGGYPLYTPDYESCKVK